MNTFVGGNNMCGNNSYKLYEDEVLKMVKELLNGAPYSIGVEDVDKIEDAYKTNEDIWTVSTEIAEGKVI